MNYPLQFKDSETQRRFDESIARQRRQVWAQNTKPAPSDHAIIHFQPRLFCPHCIHEEIACRPTIN
jgi:hypothetical protein